MLVARLLASDFPSENPRTQTRNFPYTSTLATIMKNLLLIILTLNFGLTFSQNIELIESRNFDGAIFPKTYDIPLTENPSIEKRFTPTKEEIVELEKQLRGQIKEINKNKPNQGKHYGPIIHKR